MIEDKNFQFFKTPVTFQKVIALIKKYTQSSLRDKGYYANQAALEAAFPTGEAGWYAIVGSTDTVWIWDAETTAWVNSGTSGSGDVVGASSSTDNAVARYNSTTGKVIKNSTVIIDDSGNITGINNLSASGNFILSGLAKKIFGDFSNATRANRLAFQTSTVNGNTRVPILPNGTSRLAGIDCFDGTDADNASFLQVHSDGTNNHAGLNSAKIGTGTTKDLVFQIDSVTKAKVNAADGKFNVDTLTPSLLVGTDASKNLQSVTVATSSVGTDFAASYSGSTLTLSIPNAGTGIDRGLITNLAQTIAGAKTFSDEVIFGNPNATLANLNGFTGITTTGGTTTLTNASSYLQVFTGILTQTVVLPVTSTLKTGWSFKLVNSTNQPITVNSSGGNLIASLRANTSLMCICIGTTLTTAADWDFGFTDFASVSGDGPVVLTSNSSLSNPTATGILAFTGSTTSNSSFHTTQTTGTMTAGGTAGTGLITLGQSTASQTTNIQSGATASGSTKTLNIGTGGLAGSTTNIAIGSTAGASTITISGITTIGAGVNNIQIAGAATTFGAVISAVGTDTNIPLILSPKGTGAIQAQQADGTSAGGNTRGAGAVDFQTQRNANTKVASGSRSAVIGGEDNGASGSWSGVFAGVSNVVTAASAVAIGGNSNQATGGGAVAMGSASNQANADNCFVFGGRGIARGIVSNFVQGSTGAVADATGVSQNATLLLGKITTDATPTVLTGTIAAAATTNQVTLPNNSAYNFYIRVVSGVTGGGNTAGWEFKGIIKRGANAASTSIVGLVTKTLLGADAGAATWDCNVTANTTLGCITITFTGQAGTTIRTVAACQTTEMTF